MDFISISKQDLQNLLNENERMTTQITQLQQRGTELNESLKAYKKLSLNEAQTHNLAANLQDVTERMKSMYGQLLGSIG